MLAVRIDSQSCFILGQTKPVVVYRLVTAKTIDEKIVERAAAKRKLEKLVIHRNKLVVHLHITVNNIYIHSKMLAGLNLKTRKD